MITRRVYMDERERNMAKAMRAVGFKMNLCMGVTLSFFLSLIGNLTSGHFTVPGFLISFAASTVISIIIGFIVPMKKISDKATAGMKGVKKPLTEALISDCIYTPVMTLSMILLARYMASSHGEEVPPFAPMFIKGLIISMIAGYVLVLFFMPLYLKMFTKNLPGPGAGPGPGRPQ